MSDTQPCCRESYLTLNGLRHRMVSWGPEKVGPTALLLHGYLDTARSWDTVALRLHQALPELRIVAIDWRGHGNSDWAPPGCYYHFFDYVADLAALIEGLNAHPLYLIGHSMGGNIATYYTGAYPEQVHKLALLESLVVPDTPHDAGPERVRQWIEGLKRDLRSVSRVMADLDEVARRLQITMVKLSHDEALRLAKNATHKTADGYVWRFDPLHRTRSPSPFRWDRIAPFLGKIPCPVLVCEGEHTPLPRELMTRRYALLKDHRLEVLPGAAHALHVEAPEALSRVLIEFLGG